MNRTMRGLSVAVASAGVLITAASPALAHGSADDETGFVPAPPEYYQSYEVEACGDVVRVEPGDVREVVIRETPQPDGTVVVEYQGEATLDITRLSDGARIDELDIGGPGRELISADRTTITVTLWGESLLTPPEGDAARADYEATGLPDLAYLKKGSVTFSITIDPETGEQLGGELLEVDARIIDLCQWFDRGNARNHDRGHHGHAYAGSHG